MRLLNLENNIFETVTRKVPCQDESRKGSIYIYYYFFLLTNYFTYFDDEHDIPGRLFILPPSIHLFIHQSHRVIYLRRRRFSIAEKPYLFHYHHRPHLT